MHHDTHHDDHTESIQVYKQQQLTIHFFLIFKILDCQKLFHCIKSRSAKTDNNDTGFYPKDDLNVQDTELYLNIEVKTKLQSHTKSKKLSKIRKGDLLILWGNSVNIRNSSLLGKIYLNC